jgi:hypothetical protein
MRSPQLPLAWPVPCCSAWCGGHRWGAAAGVRMGPVMLAQALLCMATDRPGAAQDGAAVAGLNLLRPVLKQLKGVADWAQHQYRRSLLQERQPP